MEKTRSITAAQITAWKKAHGTIHQITVKQDGKEFNCIVRKPNLTDVQMSEEYGKEDSIKQNMFLFNNCHIGGDVEFTTDDELRFAASNEVARLFRILKASSKKL